LEPALYSFLSTVFRSSRILMVALAILTVITGLWVIPGLFNPEFMESTSQAPFYSIQSSYQYVAPVTNDNPIWPVGTNLTLSPVYFFATSPSIQGNFTISIDAASSDLLANTTEEIVIQAEESNTTYWKKEIPLTNNTITWRGGPIVNNFAVNVSAYADEINAIQKALSFQGGTATIEVVNTVIFRGRINGVPVDEARIYSMPITLQSGSYTIPDDLTQTQGITRSRSLLLTVSGLNIFQILGIVAFVACLALFFFVLAVRLGFRERDEATVRALMHYGLHTKYADFISKGAIDETTKEAIRLASLEDMVNTALDLNERIIFDEKSVIYFFVHNGILYFFKPGEEVPGAAKPGEKGETGGKGTKFFEE
jgi:hypothetical protein